MSYCLNQFLLFDSVFYRFTEMESQLVRAIQCNQRGHRNEAAIAVITPCVPRCRRKALGQ